MWFPLPFYCLLWVIFVGQGWSVQTAYPDKTIYKMEGTKLIISSFECLKRYLTPRILPPSCMTTFRVRTVECKATVSACAAISSFFKKKLSYTYCIFYCILFYFCTTSTTEVVSAEFCCSLCDGNKEILFYSILPFMLMVV